jgi:hypothetical protein
MTKTIKKYNILIGRRSLATVVLSLWLILTIIGCSPSASNISGTRWECSASGGGLFLEFLKNNTYKESSVKDSSIYGKWILLDDGRIKMERKAKEMTYIDFAKIEGDRLRFDSQGREPLYFVKVK